MEVIALNTVHGGKIETNSGVTRDWTGDGHGPVNNVISGSGDPGQDGFPTDVVTLQPEHAQGKHVVLL